MRLINLIAIDFCALLLLSNRSVDAGEIDHSTDAANYNAVNGITIQITVRRETPMVIWSSPLPIRVGVALGPDQLNATASVPGTFVYSPPSGTVLPAGADQTLSVNFTPTDTDNYRVVNNTHVKITVNPKDNPVITWANPADITYGVALESEQLNATADVPGTFIYTPPSGTVLIAGRQPGFDCRFYPHR